MAAFSLRCMAFAYRPLDLKEIPNEEHRGDWSLPDDHLILLAIVGMKVGPQECASLLNYLLNFYGLIR